MRQNEIIAILEGLRFKLEKWECINPDLKTESEALAEALYILSNMEQGI